jgi:hypothetical protein
MIGTGWMVSASAAVHAQPTRAAVAAHARFARCPADLLRLQPAGVQRAANRALAAAPRLYRALNTHGAEVMAADRSAFAGVRGQEVATMCGKKIAARTVVVQMLFPHMLPSASLSQAVVFVGRFARGYRVWFVAH